MRLTWSATLPSRARHAHLGQRAAQIFPNTLTNATLKRDNVQNVRIFFFSHIFFTVTEMSTLSVFLPHELTIQDNKIKDPARAKACKFPIHPPLHQLIPFFPPYIKLCGNVKIELQKVGRLAPKRIRKRKKFQHCRGAGVLFSFERGVAFRDWNWFCCVWFTSWLPIIFSLGPCLFAFCSHTIYPVQLFRFVFIFNYLANRCSQKKSSCPNSFHIFCHRFVKQNACIWTTD